MKSDTTANNFVIDSSKTQIKLFCTKYKALLIILVTPFILFPVVFLGDKNEYASLYLFLVCAVYWITSALHPAVVSLVPITFYTFAATSELRVTNSVHIGNPVLECLGIMLIIIGIENSNLHNRIALKVLLIFGLSHFRLSFLLFYSSMLLAVFFSDALSCCVMLPLVRAILFELEKMGITEVHEAGGKNEVLARNRETGPTPTDFTVFYFLGITYSSSIGCMANVFGNSTNEVFLNCYRGIFPNGPNLENPQILLLTLPGVLFIETFVYLWLNFFYLGMLRVRNYTTLQTSLTGEEAQYVKILLGSRYREMGKVNFNEMVVICVLVLTFLLEIIVGSTKTCFDCNICGAINVSTPSIVGALLLFIVPNTMDCFELCKRRGTGTMETVPTTPGRACLTWSMIVRGLQWDVLFITAGCNLAFEGLKESKMTEHLGKSLTLLSSWPTPATVFVIILLSKALTEFASNTTVAHCLLRETAQLSMQRRADPRHVMLSATLAASLPFHMVTGSSTNALVASYGNIPQRKMMIAGVGPTCVSILAVLLTTCVWSKAIWPDDTTDFTVK